MRVFEFCVVARNFSAIEIELITMRKAPSTICRKKKHTLDSIGEKYFQIVPFPTDPFLEWPVIVIRIRMHRRPLFYVFNHVR